MKTITLYKGLNCYKLHDMKKRLCAVNIIFLLQSNAARKLQKHVIKFYKHPEAEYWFEKQTSRSRSIAPAELICIVCSLPAENQRYRCAASLRNDDSKVMASNVVHVQSVVLNIKGSSRIIKRHVER